jgi:DNA-binding response OmpR family regulator
MVLAHTDRGYAAQCRRFFQAEGWDVVHVATSREARQLARLLAPTVVVLDTELPDESGWLTCDKLRAELPEQKVVLVAANWTLESHAFGDFVGAAGVVHQGEGIPALAEEIASTAWTRSVV